MDPGVLKWTLEVLKWTLEVSKWTLEPPKWSLELLKWILEVLTLEVLKWIAASSTHLTLPTTLRVLISVVSLHLQ